MAKSKIQRRSKLQEKRIAKDVGGRVQAGSGSSWRAKGDVRKMGDLRIEAKYTEKPTYVLKHADLEKLRLEAIEGGLEIPVMQVEFVGGGTSYKLAIFDLQLFLDWYQKSHDNMLNMTDLVATEKQATLDGSALQSFFWGALNKGKQGVVRVIWRGLPKDYAIIEWDLFTAVHEANKS